MLGIDGEARPRWSARARRGTGGTGCTGGGVFARDVRSADHWGPRDRPGQPDRSGELRRGGADHRSCCICALMLSLRSYAASARQCCIRCVLRHLVGPQLTSLRGARRGSAGARRPDPRGGPKPQQAVRCAHDLRCHGPASHAGAG